MMRPYRHTNSCGILCHVIDRQHYLTVRASVGELGMVKALAEREGLSVSDIVRQLIRRSYAQAFGDAKPPKVKLRTRGTKKKEA